MRWRKVSEYAAISECRRYSVARVIVAGVEWFELWHRSFDERGRVSARHMVERGPSAKALVEKLQARVFHVEQRRKETA